MNLTTENQDSQPIILWDDILWNRFEFDRKDDFHLPHPSNVSGNKTSAILSIGDTKFNVEFIKFCVHDQGVLVRESWQVMTAAKLSH